MSQNFYKILYFVLLTCCGSTSELIEASGDHAVDEVLYRCPEGTYFSHQICLECPSGHFCLGDVHAPQRCRLGTFNLYTGKSESKACKPCFPGLISSEDRVDCRLCPSGFSCDAGSGTLSLCPPGQHSPEGVLDCLSCPVDSVCISGFPFKCNPGSVPNLNHTQCNECPPGFYSSLCTIKCIQCPAGNYCPVGGMSQPLACAPGWSSTPGQIKCHMCNDSSPMCRGPIVSRWSHTALRSSFRTTCRPGTFKDAQEESDCVLCPKGLYCVEGVALPCPAGTYGAKEGLQRLKDCTVCPAGFYCLEGSSQRPTSQFLCPQGYYCEEGTATPQGSPCPAGTAGEQLGQTSRAACKRCREGRFCPTGSSVPGLPCARGRYCPAGTLEEVICPGGTFTPHQGAISVKDCLKCPAGFYCPAGTSDPVPCPSGTFNPLDGQDELTDCRDCYAGKACTQVALKAPDVDCMQGYVCPPGSSKPNSQTNACPPGTLSNRTDLTDRSQCQRCPARYACLRGTGGIQRPPLSCFAGHYCPPGTMFPTQYKCPVGTFSGQSGLEYESECRPCPQGWYCLAGSAAPTGRCSSGYYCPEGTAYGTQFPCPAGTYSIQMGNRHRGDCLICPEGFFCPEGTSKPSPCPRATFRPHKGGQKLDDCLVCPAGYFCPHSATVNPRVCGVGSYSDEGSVGCSACLQGHYCSNETTSEEAMLKVMVCPPGFLCSQGLTRDPQRSATLCPRGFYCPGGGIDPNPIPCPNGTYSPFPGLRDVRDCLQCPEGKYCYSLHPREEPITSPIGPCPDGHFCPSGTGYPYTYLCLSGQYRNNTLGHDGQICVICPARYYCERQGTHTPLLCPQGFYCAAGTSLPDPCPEGTYGSRSALGDRSECSPCGGGQFCNGVGLKEPTGQCKERYYCKEGAKSATPVAGVTGGLCPAGSYCPFASSAPLPCPPGTYSNSTGLSKQEECAHCPPGFYCLGFNNTSPSGSCYPGYYCTQGSTSPVQYEANEGHYTLEGAVRAEPCPPGTFQPSRGAQSCVECPGGRLCNQTGMSRPSFCPTGHYCLPGFTVARPCPTGFFSDQSGGETPQHCRPCEAGRFCGRAGLSKPQGFCASGHYCTSGASTAFPVAMASGGVCPMGFFCPRGTRHPYQHPCPAGTWSDAIGAQNLSSCHPCPPGLYCNKTGLSQPSGLCHAGYYCLGGAIHPGPIDTVTGDICPVGHYCPLGSYSPLLCPDGTFSNSTGAGECEDCPTGTYCLSGDGVQLCPAGHYCLGGGVEGILPCPPGTYNPRFGLSQVEQCLICPAGLFCEDWGLFEPTGPCQAGYYCIAGVNFPNPDGNFSTGVGGACPQGKYCPEGTGSPLPCPSGTYSKSFHLVDPSGCSPCLPGHFCGSGGLTHPSGFCKAGFYCPGGDTAPTGSEGGPCPAAHFCSEGSASPEPCPAGSYTNLIGRTVCSSCPAGYYCPERTANFTQFPCPPGFYCPNGTRHATQFPCPRGYYNPEPMTQSLDSCLPCPPGHYCEKERLTKVSGRCEAGWFCVSAAWTSQPFDLDNYTNANCLCPATATGGRCQPGFFCPLGSSEPLPCLPGAFCNISGLPLPMGPCSPGYYCVGGAAEEKPLDGETGNICPPGTYCVEGSRHPELCPSGTVSSVPGVSNRDDCLPCPGGSYCSGMGLRVPTGPCTPGYWCPPGQILGTAQPCPLGHFCPLGSSLPIPCPAGTYQDQETQESCMACKPGYYCVESFGLSNISWMHPCPKGHYCPEGTSFPNQHPCPVGTFNPRSQANSLQGCVPCPPGLYCPSLGLTEPAGPCEAGYWCREGAFSPTPLDNLTGLLCPPGYYCPLGTTSPIACPDGTWSNSSGLGSQADCKHCLGGHYCDGTGLTKPTGPCLGGYYCLDGAVTSTPTDKVTGGVCPESYYCPEGSVQPLLCSPGTYVSVTQATHCEPCLPGWYCVSGSLYLCPAGFYCPEGTGFDMRGCPEGTYGPDPGYWSVSQCKQCDGGHYCSSRNATAVTGPCQEGYYCSHGNTSPKPLSLIAGEGGPCPVGHYCPMATAHPLPCPLGTFSNLTKLVSQEECQLCLPGHYCDAMGLSKPTGECWEGFFCLGGAYHPNPILRDNHGGPCPKGYYCSEGSAAPQPCPLGTISAMDGLPSCSICPQGFYCPVSSNRTAYESYECPMGHYCPFGTWSKYQYPCPAGSINPHLQMAKLQDCLPCPPGSFCAFPGKSTASGLCSAGYYCLTGAWSPTPTDGGKTGDLCPEGHYCPQGSSAPTPCPSGYYSNSTGNVDISSCLPCLPGFFCGTRGLSFPTHVCPAGSYCPGELNGILHSSAPCSPGNMCPLGSRAQLPCLPGSYQSLQGQVECVECPAGFYCAGSLDNVTGYVSGTHTPMLCPQGYYCPPGTKSGTAMPCPAGTFSSQMGLSNKSSCNLCPPGRYCSSSGLTAPTGLCSPGYLCIQGSVSAQPEEGPTGRLCAAGSYCPQGTSYMVPCPSGTFSSQEGGTSFQACQPCLPGYYCAEVGLSAPSGLCHPGFYCSEGSKTATPWGNSTAFPGLEKIHGGMCPAGHYCPKGSQKPTPCPPGSFLMKSGAESEVDCEICYPGYYCPSWAQTHADLLCAPGWFCPPGSVSGHLPDFLCPAGHACPLGSVAPSICSPGNFQSSAGQPICDTCPPGSYCLEGSVLPSSCPVGTVSPSAGRRFLNECLACPPGFFCNTSGLSEPSGPCRPGHFCTGGSTESAPVLRPYGDVCPIGHFCPEGSGSPKPCSSGSFLSEPGASSSSECHLCPPGKYCLGPGASQPTGLCFPGFFCVGGSDTPTPAANISLSDCFHEILNIYSNLDDILQMYNQTFLNNSTNSARDDSWIEAVPGPEAVLDNIVTYTAPCLRRPHYACTSYKGDICPEGFFCPLGTPYPLLCQTGFYCNQTGLDAPAGPCIQGFFCPKGSIDTYANPCPKGHYCPQATPLPLPCPTGTLKDFNGGATIKACRPCPPGHYCQKKGQSEPSGLCAEGYYCPGGQTSLMPQQHICSMGHYCKMGSAIESPCSLGSYQFRQGQGSCEPCPAGFYCQDRGVTFPHLCGRGFYCPNGSTNPSPCPSGTYGNTSGLTEEVQCLLCDPGMYCKGTGRTDPSGPCAAGFVCKKGASEPSPTDILTGQPCPPGFYCPVGTSAPQPCPKGTYSNKDGLVEVSQCINCLPGFYCSEPGLSSVSGPCLSGFYCLEGSSTATPKSGLSGDVCPEGHYCLEGGSVPIACPPGTYQNLTGGVSKDDCKPCPFGQFQGLSGQKECNPCPAGFHCQIIDPGPSRGSSNGVSNPEPCPAGFTCPRDSPDRQPVPCPKGTYSQNMGLTIPGECLLCPAGQFCGSDGLIGPSGPCDSGFLCVIGATVPNPMDNRTGSLCPPGYYCKQGLRAGDCLAGYFCDWGSSKADEAFCPAGFFCPRGTPAPLPCPPGTFSSTTGNTHQDNCTICLPGYYCQGEGTVQPNRCPTGHYCPPGLTLGIEFPCPPGTVQRMLGASSPNNCTACPPGMFCSDYGLSEPSGLCDPGYFCPSGSISSNSSDPQSNSTENYICPAGHFCPPGSGHPHVCPAGSLSLARGLTGVDGCLPCPPGLFCDRPALADILDALPCHAGYVCLGGSYSPTPSDGNHGYICPVGNRCPLGSAMELPCEPGTYSAAPGAAQCLVCPNGTACSSFGTKEPTVCPAGHFCPTGTAHPEPCPLGTFSNQTGAHSISVCTACPSGYYCSSYGATTPTGLCLDGYFCASGATGPAPQSSDFLNGLCPVGHYCPAGCSSPVPCPLGSIRNSTGGVSMESCSACPAGYHCSSEGLSSPSGPCAAGFYCPFDFSSTTPFAFLCPKGHYCPEGSPLALPCPTGEYQPNPGSDNCIPCRPGFYCEEAIVGDPWPCPPHSFCPAGTMVPQPCPNGTYTYSNQTGLQEEQECLPCPPGKFCRAGRIQGVCAAGYHCLSGSAEFTPQDSNLTQCQWGIQCAAPCPPGYYCPEGTDEAKSCPANTIRSTAGGANIHDCLPCPPQYWCKSGDPVLHPCPAGHYCDGLPGSDFNGGTGPRPCPQYTYRTSPGAGSKGDCLPCPAGSHCNSTGLTDFSTKLCPPGYWCSGYGAPILCPAGTKRSTPGAAELGQCEPCAGGTFCPDPRTTGLPNVEGIPCRAGYQCPLGAAAEKLCRAGSYCEPQTAEPHICPPGYFCPVGSHSYNTPKQICLFPYYCPANSTALTSCKGGSRPVNTSGLRGSQSSCCTLCTGGTYRPYLSSSLVCLLCPPGYFCPQGTESYKTHPCPSGYVCPVGSSQPKACPPGTFGRLTHAVKNSDCHLCPAGTFNHLEGQKACFPCGSSSTSSPGSSLCTCIGKNRAFQPSDGSCLCRTGFVYYDKQDLRSSSSDSVFDCQPEVNRRCAKDEVRIAATRACVSPALHSCNITCEPHGGTLDAEMGICQCERFVSAEELCNTSCLSHLPHLSAQLSSDGQLLLSLKERKGSIWARSVADILGPDSHTNNIGKIHLVEFGSEGVFGWIPKEIDLIQHFLTGPVEVLNTRHRDRRDTRGENKSDRTILPRIHNPIACISSGDMLLFQLTINHTDRHQSHFPVYQKDHLFNSNPSWDFGAFRQLQILMKQTNVNSTRFAHVFSEPGKYVFVDNAIPEWTLVVVVTEQGTECNRRAAVFQPMTPAQLVRFGIVKQHQLNLLPDWELITGFLSVFLALVVVLTSTVLVLRPGKSKLIAHSKNRPKWRNVGEPFCPIECNCTKDSPATPRLALILGSRGVGEGAEAEEPAISKGSVSGRCDLEEFNVKTLYDKLEDQNLHIASQLARHRKDAQEFYRTMCQQIETLTNILENMDNKKLLLLKELLIHSASKDKVTQNSRADERDPQDEAFAVLLGAVLRSVEALLCKMTLGEAWHHQYVLPQDDRECVHGEANICYTQFSSAHLAKDESLSEPVPCLSDHDLSKLVSITPLFQTLQDIQQSLQNLTAGESCLPDISTGTDEPEMETGSENGELIATALDSLSPQHSAIYLFGCQVMQLLSACPLFPPVLLLLAKSVPTSLTSAKLMEHCSKYFYFDATNQILYLSENRLHHVGHFISTLVQSMAHIAAGSKPQMFMKALHEAISVLSLQLFKLSLQWNAGSKLDMSEEQQNSLVSEFLNIRVPAETHFTEHVLASRLEKYKYLKVEQLISKLKQSSTEDWDRVKCVAAQGSPVQMSCIEEEIDRLNESFIQLSMQLQNGARIRRDAGNSSIGSPSRSASPSSIPSLSRNGTILVELKRRYVSQRLNELQITLEHIRRSQQHDSDSQAGTRSLIQIDSSSTHPGQSQLSPGIGPHSASHAQRQDSTEASRNHWQPAAQAAERTDHSIFKYESHITEQQLDNQTSYPHTLLEAQHSQSQLQAT